MANSVDLDKILFDVMSDQGHCLLLRCVYQNPEVKYYKPLSQSDSINCSHLFKHYPKGNCFKNKPGIPDDSILLFTTPSLFNKAIIEPTDLSKHCWVSVK